MRSYIFLLGIVFIGGLMFLTQLHYQATANSITISFGSIDDQQQAAMFDKSSASQRASSRNNKKSKKHDKGDAESGKKAPSQQKVNTNDDTNQDEVEKPKKELGEHELQIRNRVQQNAKLAEFHRLEEHEIKGMSSCLFIMDDTIRLLEWLPYHYTVLPLQYLVVGIDPHSKNVPRILHVLERWQRNTDMNITIWPDDQIYLQDVPDDKAWKRKYWLDKNKTIKNPFHNNRTTLEYKSQEHKRRQNIFTAACFKEHHLARRDWVMNLDTDEFLIPNYYDGADEKEQANASSFLIHYAKTEEGIKRDRQEALNIREHLPPLTQRMTVSEILHQAQMDRCLKIPALNFTAHYHAPPDSTTTTTATPPRLSTLSQTRTGPKEGRTTKVLLDVSRARIEYLVWEKVVNVHNPNKRMCGWNGVIGSGTDYISSVFRYHHYVAGSLESYLERSKDYRRRESSKELLEHYFARNFEPEETLENMDIFPWIDWFEKKVGKDAAKELLYDPLTERYDEMYTELTAALNASDLAFVESRLRIK